MFHLQLIDRLKFHLERQLAKGAFYQLLVAWMLVLVVSVTGGVLVTALHGPGEVYSDNIWWAFLRLTDPGYLGDDDGVARRIISTVLTVLGYVLFMGTLVAIMTQWLTAKMRTLERGITPVALREHITVLGWTSRTIPILLDILARGPLESGADGKRQRSRISVLAEDITAGASAEFYSQRELASKRRQVILRSGSILNPEHLHRVAASEARVVIIPSQAENQQELLTADSEAIKVLLSLNAQSPPEKLPMAIVELQSAEKIPLAKHSYQGPLQLVASDVVIARAFSQSVLEPGLSEVLDYLLVDANGCQLYLSSAAHLQGKYWADVSAHYHAAIPCGLVRRESGQSTPLLTPPADVVIGKDDALILLANQEKEIVYLEPQRIDSPPLADGPVLTSATKQPSHKLLLLGWNSRVPKVTELLSKALGKGLQLTSISTMPAKERRAQVSQWENWDFIEADYSRPSVLANQGVDEYDSILVFATDRLEGGEEADARSIVTNQLLDYLLDNTERRPQVLVELTDPNNAVYVSAHRHKLRSEVIQSSAMISHLLAQLAIYPDLRLVYDNLLSPDGVGLHLVPVPAAWLGRCKFIDLQQAVAGQNAVLLGVKQGEERSQLNLTPTIEVDCDEQTRLVVMGEQCLAQNEIEKPCD